MQLENVRHTIQVAYRYLEIACEMNLSQHKKTLLTAHGAKL